eukprot:PhM_4_TR8239/c0_g1_i2/m.60316/K02183/CALM; calmodulin
MTDALTQQQISEFSEAFDLFDYDGEGKISVAHIHCVLQSLGLSPMEYNIETLKKAKAEDGEDSVDLFEFLQLMSTSQTITAAEEAMTNSRLSALEEAFAVLDPNDTGSVKTVDLRRILKELMKEQELDKFMHTADPTESGTVHYKVISGLLMAGA